MAKNFVMAESECAAMVNKMQSSLSFIQRTLQSYNEILQDLMDADGIQDDDICASLKMLQAHSALLGKNISEVESELVSKTRVFRASVESNDNFVFPMDWMTEVLSFLSELF